MTAFAWGFVTYCLLAFLFASFVSALAFQKEGETAKVFFWLAALLVSVASASFVNSGMPTLWVKEVGIDGIYAASLCVGLVSFVMVIFCLQRRARA